MTEKKLMKNVSEVTLNSNERGMTDEEFKKAKEKIINKIEDMAEDFFQKLEENHFKFK